MIKNLRIITEKESLKPIRTVVYNVPILMNIKACSKFSKATKANFSVVTLRIWTTDMLVFFFCLVFFFFLFNPEEIIHSSGLIFNCTSGREALTSTLLEKVGGFFVYL